MVLIQDIKDRQVYWFLFPIIGLCSGVLLYQNMLPALFYITIFINFIFIAILVAVVFLYSKIKLKTSISNTFGLGDGLLFLVLAFSFSSISFLILFVFGLIFSLTLHLLLKRKLKQITVPLAGYLSLFFAVTYISYWLGILKSIYII
ncbi:hypothetical protein [Bizionia argentinensis]|uniref:hypothetical protein n=1 Tax=Bizionia argentinensis TaxID=456455 RepID=UPI0002E8FFE7|nr:hypothetical protein [Bizionia argentinensis]